MIMADQHSYSFFGQKSAFFFQSPSRSVQYLFFRFIKKKNNGIWEKPSNKEGTVIKLSLEEQAQILEVLEKNSLAWSGYHAFKGNKTPINVKWETPESTRLWINIGNYSKMLQSPEITILRMLMEHVLQEKIEHATQPSFSKKASNSMSSNHVQKKVNSLEDGEDLTLIMNDSSLQIDSKNHVSNESFSATQVIEKDYGSIQGKIKGETAKALLLITGKDKEQWIPKSTIKSDYDVNNKATVQSFTVENWLLNKNNILD